MFSGVRWDGDTSGRGIADAAAFVDGASELGTHFAPHGHAVRHDRGPAALLRQRALDLLARVG